MGWGFGGGEAAPEYSFLGVAGGEADSNTQKTVFEAGRKDFDDALRNTCLTAK
jgi:hypothetical protein